MSVGARVEALLETGEPDRPGVGVGLSADDVTLYVGGYGLADLATRTAITPRTVFDTCSIAKPFVALTIASLIDQGVIDPDGAVRSWIPELPSVMQPITLRHLLTNTSGIRDFNALAYLTGRAASELSSDQVLGLLANQRDLNFPPGEGFLYSHSDYFLLAVCAERASNVPFTDLSRDRIFAPLGMHRTSFLAPEGSVAQGYTCNANGLEPRAPQFRRIGSGGLFSTVEDLASWDRALRAHALGAAGELFLGSVSRAALLRDRRQCYAWGLVLSSDHGLSTTGNGGAWDGYSTAYLHLPESRVSAIVLSNLGSFDAFWLAEQLIDIGLAEVTGTERGTVAWSRLKSGPRTEAIDRGPTIPHRGPPCRDGADVPDADRGGVFYSEELDVLYDIDSDPAGSIVVYRADDVIVRLDRESVRLEVGERDGECTLNTQNARQVRLSRLQVLP